MSRKEDKTDVARGRGAQGGAARSNNDQERTSDILDPDWNNEESEHTEAAVQIPQTSSINPHYSVSAPIDDISIWLNSSPVRNILSTPGSPKRSHDGSKGHSPITYPKEDRSSSCGSNINRVPLTTSLTQPQHGDANYDNIYHLNDSYVWPSETATIKDASTDRCDHVVRDNSEAQKQISDLIETCSIKRPNSDQWDDVEIENNSISISNISTINWSAKRTSEEASNHTIATKYSRQDRSASVGSEIYRVPLNLNLMAPQYGFENFYRNDSYVDYEVKYMKQAQEHPSAVVESFSLSLTQRPAIKYQFKMPRKVIEEGRLSNVQLEAVAYACRRHEYTLCNRTRAGILIGDGAGVGKGRTISGIIYENFLCDRKRSLWISVSGDLVKDAERDLADIGARIQVSALQKLSFERIDSEQNGRFKEGVLFVTYATLMAKSKQSDYGPEKSRLDQIVEWFGKHYDGVIVFDECHRVMNVAGDSRLSKTQQVVIQLQDKLYDARIVYACATGASRPEDVGCMDRLGLWGGKNRLKSYWQFKIFVSKNGVGSMQRIARKMKDEGAYLSRQLSLQYVTFEIKEVKVEGVKINKIPFKEVYNRCVSIWSRIYEEFANAYSRHAGLIGRHKMFLEGRYWYAHKRFFAHLRTAAKIASCVKTTLEEIPNSKCVVIGLQSTGVALPVEIIESLIADHFPSLANIHRLREKGERGHSEGSDSSDSEDAERLGNGIGTLSVNADSESQRAESEIIKLLYLRIAEVKELFPVHLLDKIIAGLGTSEFVAEITRRSGRPNVSQEPINIVERDRFNSAKVLVAVVSDAGGAGVSLHSGRGFFNQLQRFHIALELPSSADEAMQQLGRTHRSNQVVPPHYILLVSDLAGERRLAAAVAKRLESLRALRLGDGGATDARDLGQLDLDSGIGTKALRALMAAIYKSEEPMIPFSGQFMSSFDNCIYRLRAAVAVALGRIGLTAEAQPSVARFLKRMIGMEIDLQMALFQYFVECVAHLTAIKEKSELEAMGDSEDKDVKIANTYIKYHVTFKSNKKPNDS